MYVVNAVRTENGGTCLTVVPHVCGVCKKAFLQENVLLKHLQSHDEEPSTVTGFSKVDLLEDIKSNCVKNPTDIDFVSTSVEKRNTEENILKKLHVCNICKVGFNSKTYLLKHIELHEGDRPYKCDICHKSFIRKDNLMKHFAMHDPDKKRFFCLECGKGFTSRQYKETHELIHLGEKPHICSICRKAFTLKTNLNKHMLIHSAERSRYLCDTCGKDFTSRQYKEKHELIHSGEKPHICNICQRAFTLKTNLNKHILTHSKERYRHLCDLCGKGFISKAYLEKHHLIHIGEKPHVCGICHKAFTLKTNLHKHYLTHTGYRRFGCDICCKRFKTKGTLDQHYLLHSEERPFQCPKCQQDFKQKIHMEKHLLTHIENSDFVARFPNFTDSIEEPFNVARNEVFISLYKECDQLVGCVNNKTSNLEADCYDVEIRNLSEESDDSSNDNIDYNNSLKESQINLKS